MNNLTLEAWKEYVRRDGATARCVFIVPNPADEHEAAVIAWVNDDGYTQTYNTSMNGRFWDGGEHNYDLLREHREARRVSGHVVATATLVDKSLNDRVTIVFDAPTRTFKHGETVELVEVPKP